MSVKKPHRFWRVCRIVFRWTRITLWLLLLSIITAILYLNTIGLPDFLKQPLLAELRDRGWNVEFESIRWGWFRGVVIDRPVFSPVEMPNGTSFKADRAELNADFSKVLDSKVTVNSLVVQGGEFTARVDTNTAPLTIENIDAKILLLPGDRLLIDPFEAQFRKVRFQLSCDVTNVSELRQLNFLLPEKKTSDSHESALKHWFETVQEIDFTDEPQIKLTVSGDLRHWRTMQAHLTVNTAGANTPWGQLNKTTFAAMMNPRGTTTNFPSFSFDLKASNVRSAWGSVRSWTNHGEVTFSQTLSNVLECAFTGEGQRFQTAWPIGSTSNAVQSSHTTLSGTALFSLTNSLPLFATAEVKLRNAGAQWQQPQSTNLISVDLKAAEMSVQFDASAAAVVTNSEHGFWEHLRPFIVNGRFDLGPSSYRNFGISNLLLTADWSWPRLEVMDLQGALHGGTIAGQGYLDIDTREFFAKADSSFDALKLAPLLPRPGRRFLENWHWNTPPRGIGEVRVVLPRWNDPKPNWYREVLPTLQLDAKVAMKNGSYRNIEANSAQATIHYSNMVWRLPDIHVARPEGEMHLSLIANDRDFTFEWLANGVFDPNAIRPQLNKDQQMWLDQVTFAKAPKVNARIVGKWGEIDSLGVEARLSTEAFKARGVEFSSLSTDVVFTNRVFDLSHVLLKRKDKEASADHIIVDLQTHRIYFNNVASTMDPMLVAHVIGEQVVDVLSPYKFATPPHILLNGSLGLKTIKTADMHFEIAGQDFQWGYLRADAGSARASWVNQSLILTNISASAYGGGTLTGNGFVDFIPKGGAAYRLEANFTNVNAASLVSTLNATNQVEGLLNGYLVVDNANTTGLHTWNGHGRTELSDGLLWEVKIFGIFTPILDAIIPGLGKSRARSAAGSFVIRNGVAYSDDLEIRSSAFRMQYKGALSHDGTVDARVLAEPLRDTWAVGRVLSTALMPLSKLFEYKISGTVNEPEMKPLYVPKVVMMTLRPFKTLKKLLDTDKADATSDSVPVAQP